MRALIDIDAEQCQDLGTALKKEWLVANGIGGYASSTIVGANTRKYHGLLVAALKPPLQRLLLLSKIDESLFYQNRPHLLSTNVCVGRVFPTGYQYIVNFRLAPFPIFTYIVEDLEIEKRVFVLHGHNSVVIKYRLLTDGAEAELRLSPLVAFRHLHELRVEEANIDTSMRIEPGVCGLRPYAHLPELWFHHNAGVVTPTSFWHKDFEYQREEEAGAGAVEDLLNPFELCYRFSAKEEAFLGASLDQSSLGSIDALERGEIQRVARRVKSFGILSPDVRVDALAIAADSFVVRSSSGATILAGYPRLTEEGRCALVSFRGLLLSGKRYEEAREVLLRQTSLLKRGRLPRFLAEDSQHLDYDAADIALWLFIASEEYYRATADLATVANPLYPALASILRCYKEDMVPGVRVDADGLLATGTSAGPPLTWMDAQVGGVAVTPRMGKCVEVNALWYNAHKIAAHFAALLEDEENAERYEVRAAYILESFCRVFWNEKRGHLNDVVSAAGADASLRPNQIFAISLPFALLEGERAEQVFDAVGKSLLTQLGLRSLARGEPRYSARCEGDEESRKRALHHGCVYPWLIGAYIDALLRVRGTSARACAAGFSLLQAFVEHLEDAGLGSISELFDGDAPHIPSGCTSYAMSVAEVIRAYARLGSIRRL
jgi:predicted glycogen debranching enzyme